MGRKTTGAVLRSARPKVSSSSTIEEENPFITSQKKAPHTTRRKFEEQKETPSGRKTVEPFQRRKTLNKSQPIEIKRPTERPSTALQSYKQLSKLNSLPVNEKKAPERSSNLPKKLNTVVEVKGPFRPKSAMG